MLQNLAAVTKIDPQKSCVSVGAGQRRPRTIQVTVDCRCHSRPVFNTSRGSGGHPNSGVVPHHIIPAGDTYRAGALRVVDKPVPTRAEDGRLASAGKVDQEGCLVVLLA